MESLYNSTINEIHETLDGELSKGQIKSIIYSAYSYPSPINETNLNNVRVLLARIDWNYFIENMVNIPKSV